ncbi:hypothetical protein MLP_03950 [Microlunatus phosphovorus NM-1]|uniref:HEPN domain-containing protein n=1 Tax=Microlunatus phosphovorus (strain ATCC 700054 / DSM 10555 / JCM 9379 / NBRC 101784 / NCIMB 13414 / VKM Ac-1990 / NM-1) TaxID=1032480 RepID=F5XJ83_MICPN|nr:hypothetical protein [Microlunatus phosphovorus]BAK33409.1 hypothetical protein MLP_03950 [Microlunatus phosphovorus NM-1]
MSPRHSGRIVDCTPSESRTRRDHARAFLEVAELVLTEERREAHVAAALAVLAGIAAADAICGLNLGKWSRGQDHRQAVDLLNEVALHDHSLPTKLGRLVADKDAVHYSPNLITVDRAKTMVRLATALLAEADRR